jgi:hypothetical protein
MTEREQSQFRYELMQEVTRMRQALAVVAGAAVVIAACVIWQTFFRN